MYVIPKYLSFILIIALFTAGCGYGPAKKRLAEREQKIVQRENELALKEQELKVFEQQLLKGKLRLDSARRLTDSVGTYNPKIIGEWKVTMQCTETNCTGYAVGDTKTEQWKISYNAGGVLVSAYVNNKVVRTYTGLFRNNGLELTAEPGAQTHMVVTLSLENEKDRSMVGQRTISKANECRTVFALRAEKI